jgi:hypothetical protein
LRYFFDFQNAAQNKQLPNERKFAQSGHPVHNVARDTAENKNL